jgi:DNA-3-methyladenine glycosylase
MPPAPSPAHGSPAPLPCAFFERPVLQVARDLLGCTFLFEGVGGRLVEVEAYRADDPASHSYRGRTARNAVMFGPAGRLYVYFTMGVHFCVNVVCQAEGEAAAVLLRALEPTHGIELMRARRARDDERQLCSGPGKLTQALGITLAHGGLEACREARGGAGATCFLPRLGAAASDPSTWSLGAPRVVQTRRIGVSSAAEVPWRFVDADSRFLSRPLRRPDDGRRSGV